MWEDDPVEQRRWMRKKAERERKRREKEAKKKQKSLSTGKCGDDCSTSGSDGSESKRLAKKEKWGEHRTTERRKEETSIDCSGGACGARVVSPH